MTAPLLTGRGSRPAPLDRLLAIEAAWARAPDPDGYLAALCELRANVHAHREGLFRWLSSATGAVQNCDDPDERQARRDAVVDLAVDAEAWLEQLITTWTPRRRPNLQSWLVCRLFRRRGRYQRRASRALVFVPPEALHAYADQRGHGVERRVLAAEVVAEAEPLARAVVEEDSIAAAARRLGVTRQAIYRRLGKLSTWAEEAA